MRKQPPSRGDAQPPSWGDADLRRKTLHLASQKSEQTYHGWNAGSRDRAGSGSPTPSAVRFQDPQSYDTLYYQSGQAPNTGHYAQTPQTGHYAQAPQTGFYQSAQTPQTNAVRFQDPQASDMMYYQSAQTPQTGHGRQPVPSRMSMQSQMSVAQLPDRRSLFQSSPVRQDSEWQSFQSFGIEGTSAPSRGNFKHILKFAIPIVVLGLIFIICLAVQSKTTRAAYKENPSGNWSGTGGGSPIASVGAKLILITWNQAMIQDTAQLSRKLSDAQDASVAIVCQQETTQRFQDPVGWDRIYKERFMGMTKPGQLEFAHQFISVYHRRLVGKETSARVVKYDFKKLSASGKGGQWAKVEFCENKLCVNFVGACSHMPTEPKDRNKGLGKLLWNIAKKVGVPCDNDFIYPPKQCWGDLHGVFVTGDLNYRLDGSLKKPALPDEEMLPWLRRSVANQKWSEMLELDTLKRDAEHTLLSPRTAFTCNTPDKYGPTYKVKDASTCQPDNIVDCVLPKDKVPMKGDEIGIGWLDRVCWYGSISLHSEEWLYQMTGASDHVPLYFVLNI